MKEYKILKNDKFREKNKNQKRQLILTALAAFAFLEATFVNLTGSIYCFATGHLVLGAAFAGCSLLTACASEYSNVVAKAIDSKNNIMVSNQVNGFKDKYEDAKYRLIARR